MKNSLKHLLRTSRRTALFIPKNSVQASDENNIAGFNYFDVKTVTFQIENGTIDDFDAALRAAVPQTEDLIITYNDNGYTEIMESLQSTRAAAWVCPNVNAGSPCSPAFWC